MKIKTAYTKNNQTTYHEVELTSWTMDDVATYIPEEMIRQVVAVDPLAVQRLEKETRNGRIGVPAYAIGSDVMEEYFRKWHKLGGLSDDDLKWLLTGTVG